MDENDNLLLKLFFWYSKLFTIGINRKKFEIISTGDRLWAVNNSKNTFFALLFTLCSCGLLFSGLIELFDEKSEKTIGFFIFFIIVLPVGLLGLRQFLWLINGRQELTIEHGNLTLIKKGTFLTNPRTYSLDKVMNVRQAVVYDNMTLYNKILYNIRLNVNVTFTHAIGQIVFDYQNGSVALFIDLDAKERESLIAEIIGRKREEIK